MSTSPRTLRHPLAERNAPAALPEAPLWHAVSRGVALFLGAWCLLDVWSDVRFPSAETNWIWIDLRPLPAIAARGGLSLLGVLLLYFAIGKTLSPPLRGLSIGLTGALFGAALINTVQWYGAVSEGEIRSLVRVPLVLQTAAFSSVILAGLIAHASQEVTPPARKHWILAIVVFDVCLVLLPVTQILCSGTVDDRRSHDVLLIDLAAASEPELAESTRERIFELARENPDAALALIGDTSTTRVLRDELAAEWPARAIVVAERPDRAGDRKSMVRALAAEHQWRRALACGDPVVLPRLRFDALRAGLVVSQVPLRWEIPDDWPAIGREIPALWLSRFGGTTLRQTD